MLGNFFMLTCPYLYDRAAIAYFAIVRNYHSFHAVGPIYHHGRHGEAELLASCYTTCLKLAEERGAGSISFPSISTGAYGYPLEQAAAVALDAVSRYLEQPEAKVREVILVLFDRRAYGVHARLLESASSGSVE